MRRASARAYGPLRRRMPARPSRSLGVLGRIERSCVIVGPVRDPPDMALSSDARKKRIEWLMAIA